MTKDMIVKTFPEGIVIDSDPARVTVAKKPTFKGITIEVTPAGILLNKGTELLGIDKSVLYEAGYIKESFWGVILKAFGAVSIIFICWALF